MLLPPLLPLLLCISSATGTTPPAIISTPAEGKVSVACDPLTGGLPALEVRLVVAGREAAWLRLEVRSGIEKLDTQKLFLLLRGNRTRESSNFSCSSDSRERQELNPVSSAPEELLCRTPCNWTRLSWERNGHMIAGVSRGEQRLDLLVEGNRTTMTITSIISSADRCSDSQGGEEYKILQLACHMETGFQRFMGEKYWIIAVSALSYISFCLLATGCYVYLRRKRKAEKHRRDNTRFFKVSTTRNLYMEAFKEEPVNHKDQEFTYQNYLTKDPGGDHLSNKSSFLEPSEEGDSYLDPNEAEDQDHLSDDPDDGCYENANEELRDPSEGSQSYEDMNGSACLRTENDNGLTVEKIQEEDTDSYVNMEAPEVDRADIKSLGEPPSAPLQEENGDYYLSYQSCSL